jgi:hypothetical protein
MLFGSKRQADAIYSNVWSAFDLDSNTLVLHELSAPELYGCYVNWLRSYLTKRQ